MRPNQKRRLTEIRRKKLSDENLEGKITLLFSGDGRDGSIEIRQNAEVYMASLQAGESYNWKPNVILPNLWIQLIEGGIEVNDHKLEKADGLGIENLNKELIFSATIPK